MRQIIEKLKDCIAQELLDFGDGESVLTMLYEAYSECNRMDDAKIKADFSELYRSMNGMSLRDMDRIIYPVTEVFLISLGLLNHVPVKPWNPDKT